MSFTHNTFVKVRYAETDQMGVVHHGNYPLYLELARIDWLNNLGLSYKKMEDQGVMLPVYDLKISYLFPAHFDDELRVETSLEKLPRASIIFNYKITNQNNKLITKAQTTLVFLDKKTNRPTRCPQYILDKLSA